MPHAIDDVPWTGSPQFVIGLDIGTAHSSVSYCRLEPGKMPLLERVTHWPSAAGFGGTDEAKTASKLFYDKNNKMQVAGAEVYTPRNRHAAKDNEWHLVRYFKLLLHPAAMANGKDFNIEALPTALTIERVYARTHSTPHQRSTGFGNVARLRSAVVMSGFIDERASSQRVKFVTEAEASMHYILWKQFKSIRPGDQFIICDAGGSTVDTTAYHASSKAEDMIHETVESNHHSDEFAAGNRPVGGAIKKKKKGMSGRLKSLFRKKQDKAPAPPPQTSPDLARRSAPAIRLNEIRVSDCQPAGGIFVNEAFIEYLKSTLYTQPPDQQNMVEQFIQKGEENFELHCKREFTVGPGSQPYYVVEAGVSLPDNPDGICKIDSGVVKGFFEEPIRRIINSIHSQLAGLDIKYIFLVGGFGSSKFLRQRIEDEFRSWGVQVLFLDDTFGKAASDGSLIWYTKQRVVGRVARRSIGRMIVDVYNPNLPEHRYRSPVTLANGCDYITGKWNAIVERGQLVDPTFAIRKSYERMYSSPNPDLGKFDVDLYAWSNERASPPGWVVDPNDKIIDGFELICFISANISALQGALRKDRNAVNCWKLDFTLCIEFDGVELKAKIEWVEKGIPRSGPAQILSDWA